MSTGDGQQLRQQQGTRAIGVGDQVVAHDNTAVFTGEAGVLPKPGRVFISAPRKAVEKFVIYMLYEVTIESLIQGEIASRRDEVSLWVPDGHPPFLGGSQGEQSGSRLIYTNVHPGSAFEQPSWQLTDEGRTNRTHEPVYEINEEGSEFSLTGFTSRNPGNTPIAGTTINSSADASVDSTYEWRIPYQANQLQEFYAYLSGRVRYTRPPGATDTGVTYFTVVVQVNNLNAQGGVGAAVSYWIWDFSFERDTSSPVELILNGAWRLESDFEQFFTQNGNSTDTWFTKDGSRVQFYNNNNDHRASQTLDIDFTSQSTLGRRVIIRFETGVNIGTLEFIDFKIHFQPNPLMRRAYIGAGQHPYGAIIYPDTVDSSMRYFDSDPNNSIGPFGGFYEGETSRVAYESSVTTGVYPPITAIAYDWRADYDLTFDQIPDYSDVNNPCTLSLLNNRGANVYNGVAYICDLEQIVEGDITLRAAIEDDPVFYQINPGLLTPGPVKYVSAVVKAYPFSIDPGDSDACLFGPAIGQYTVQIPTIRTAHQFRAPDYPASAKILSLTFQPPKKATQNP